MNYNIKDFTRGGQTTMHAIRMFVQSMKYITFFSLLSCITIFCYKAYYDTTPYQRYIYTKYLEAKIYSPFFENYKINIKTRAGEKKLEAKRFMIYPATKRVVNRVDYVVAQAAVQTAVSFLFIAVIFGFIFFKRGKRQRDKKSLRGANIVSNKDLVRALAKDNKLSNFKLAGVNLKKDYEVVNTLITGTTGSGKSNAIRRFMHNARASKQKAVVYDKKGSFIQEFYRPGIDIILNPLDERCPLWNIWADCKDDSDFEGMALALIPEGNNTADPFWTDAARTIFSALASQLRKQNKCTMQDFLRPIFTQPDDNETHEDLSEILKGTVAESLVSKKIEKTALSIKATLSAYCKSLMFLKDKKEECDKVFSIRDWVKDEGSDSWIFISVVDSLKMPVLKPLISVWLDIAAKSLLTLSLNRDRRIWLFYDELGTAQKLPSLEMLLSEGREYGSCNVVSVLDKEQLMKTYGQHSTNSMLSLFNTTLFFRTNSELTAKWMSGVMGKREVVERRESVSMGANEIRDGVSINEVRLTEPVVLDTEFTNLPDLEAYLRVPGAYPSTLLKFDFLVPEFSQEALISRNEVELFDLERRLIAVDAADEDKEPIKKIYQAEGKDALLKTIVAGLNHLNGKSYSYKINDQVSILKEDIINDNKENEDYVKQIKAGKTPKKQDLNIIASSAKVNIVLNSVIGAASIIPNGTEFDRKIHIVRTKASKYTFNPNTTNETQGEEIKKDNAKIEEVVREC